MEHINHYLKRPFSESVWNQVNRKLLAKSLAELMHEEVAKPQRKEVLPDGKWAFCLVTDKPEIEYHFKAAKRLLDYWHIFPETIRKRVSGVDEEALDVLDFFSEMQGQFGVDAFTLAHYTEELLNTLYADAAIASKGRLSSTALALADYQVVEQQMDGHPWVIVNKGRLGFNAADYKAFAPEQGQDTSLIWLAAHSERATFYTLKGMDKQAFYREELGEELLASFNAQLKDLGFDPQDYHFIPVHRWQLENKILQQFQPDMVRGKLVVLGTGADRYTPQQSIRTFFNKSDAGKHYVKTAVSILSTGNIRGLSPKQMAVAPRITEWVKGLLEGDAYLQGLGLILLGEVATVAYHHPQYHHIVDGPYQYREMLGALWRESAQPKLQEGERMLTMAALLYVDDQGIPLVEALAAQAGVSMEHWLQAYLDAYLKPLLHMYYRHSLCVTPHGENIILVMRDGLPTRMIVKDFVDDIVLTAEAREKLPTELADGLIQSSNKENVPLFILLGVFDAFFRYLSDILHSHQLLDERRFWGQVLLTVRAYEQEHPDLVPRFEKYNLFVPQFKRFYINSLRLLYQGYAERTGFAIPQKGGTLPNPLFELTKQDAVEQEIVR